MVTIKDIANRLGISVSTVSKGLNGASDISEDLRQMVLDTAVEMGYQSKKMKKDENKKLCLFIENMEYETANQFGYEIILGFRQAAFRDGWSVSVVPVTPAFQMTEKYDTYMLKNGYSGGFLVGFALHDDWMRQLAFTSIPTVLFDNYIKKNPHVCYVGTDNFEGIELIRPLYLVKEEDIISWRNHNELTFINCACRFTEGCSLINDGTSKRKEMKELIKNLRKTNKEVDHNIFKSLDNVNLNCVLGTKKDGNYESFLDHYD